MSQIMTRRRALRVGTAAAGLAAAGCAKGGAPVPEQASDAGQQDFLSPWSPPATLARDLTPGPTPIRLAAWMRSAMFMYPKEGGIRAMVKRVRDAGYTAANCSVGLFQRNPWLDASEADIRELKDALAEFDVAFFDMHAYANNIHPDLAERSKIQRHVIEQCEAAERVGCPMVTTQTGSASPVSAITIHPDNWTMATWKTSVQAMKDILAATAGMKVALGIEALNLININNPRAHKRLIEDVADPRCKVCYDPTNQVSPATYYRTTELINEGFDLLGEDIIAAHAKAPLITPDKMSCYITEVAAGKGEMDYETYLVRLSRLSSPRALIVEHIPDEEQAGAKTFIEQTASKVGVKLFS